MAGASCNEKVMFVHARLTVNRVLKYSVKKVDSEVTVANLLQLSQLYRAARYYQILLPTDGQKKCFKRSINIDTKNAPTCFSVITIIRERTV